MTSNPCFYCCDRICCRQMCRAKKDYLDFQEGTVNRIKLSQPRSSKNPIVTVNKNGIRREEYI